MTTPRRLLLLLALTSLLGACATSAAPSAPVITSPPPSTAPSDAPPPSAIDLPTTDPNGGGAPGNIGGGTVDPILPIGSADPNDPAGGGAALVRPRAGQKDPHPVAPTKLEASIDGRHVLIKVSWYSGVEPCSVLDSVAVDRAASTIAITPMEGIGDPDAMCIEIAVLKATIVDLGDLEPGTWTISAPTGDAEPLELTIA